MGWGGSQCLSLSVEKKLGATSRPPAGLDPASPPPPGSFYRPGGVIRAEFHPLRGGGIPGGGDSYGMEMDGWKFGPRKFGPTPCPSPWGLTDFQRKPIFTPTHGGPGLKRGAGPSPREGRRRGATRGGRGSTAAAPPTPPSGGPPTGGRPHAPTRQTMRGGGRPLSPHPHPQPHLGVTGDPQAAPQLRKGERGDRQRLTLNTVPSK